MLIIAGKIYVDPDSRETYLRDCWKLVEQARTAPGCLDFSLAADLLEPGRINIFERWDSEENLEAFRGSGPSQAQTAEIRDAAVSRYLISETGPA